MAIAAASGVPQKALFMACGMANKGATVPELAASAGWSMDTAAKNMDTYVVTSGPLADEGHNLRDENIKGTEK